MERIREAVAAEDEARREAAFAEEVAIQEKLEAQQMRQAAASTIVQARVRGIAARDLAQARTRGHQVVAILLSDA